MLGLTSLFERNFKYIYLSTFSPEKRSFVLFSTCLIRKYIWQQLNCIIHYIEFTVLDLVQSWSAPKALAFAAVVVAIYLLLVLKILPAYMKNRPPYKLKGLLMFYNTFQVIYSAYLVGIYSIYMWKYGVFPIQCPKGELLKKVTNDIFPYFLAKQIDLLDTVFFVLRKKDNQVTFLHVYHHSIMVTWGWLYYAYHPSDHFVFIGMLNSLIHVIMYAYYGLSTIGPRVEKYLWWKKHLTKIQLVQFILVVLNLHYQQQLTPCPIHNYFHYFSVFSILSFFVLFMNFYLKSYVKRTSKEYGIQNKVKSKLIFPSNGEKLK